MWAARTLAPLDPGTVVMPAVIFSVEAAPLEESAAAAPAMSPADPAGNRGSRISQPDTMALKPY